MCLVGVATKWMGREIVKGWIGVWIGKVSSGIVGCVGEVLSLLVFSLADAVLYIGMFSTVVPCFVIAYFSG